MAEFYNMQLSPLLEKDKLKKKYSFKSTIYSKNNGIFKFLMFRYFLVTTIIDRLKIKSVTCYL